MGQQNIQQPFDNVSVAGFDEFYQQDAEQAQTAPALAQGDPSLKAQEAPDQEIQRDPTQGISLEDASRILGLHMDTVRKRLQKGKIKGFKVADKFGDKWLVDKDEVERSRPVQPQTPNPIQSAPELVQADPIDQAQGEPRQVQTDPVVEIDLGPEQAQACPMPPLVADQEYARLITIIESQAHQLKAAGDVIVYLRNEIDDAKNQVKLLTDSQHKQTEKHWWPRFCSWFAGK